MEDEMITATEQNYTYHEIRDSIIAALQLSPTEYLTVTDLEAAMPETMPALIWAACARMEKDGFIEPDLSGASQWRSKMVYFPADTYVNLINRRLIERHGKEEVFAMYGHVASLPNEAKIRRYIEMANEDYEGTSHWRARRYVQDTQCLLDELELMRTRLFMSRAELAGVAVLLAFTVFLAFKFIGS